MLRAFSCLAQDPALWPSSQWATRGTMKRFIRSLLSLLLWEFSSHDAARQVPDVLWEVGPRTLQWSTLQSTGMSRRLSNILPSHRLVGHGIPFHPPVRLRAVRCADYVRRPSVRARDTASSRVEALSFESTAETWFSTVRGDTNRRSAICVLERLSPRS